MISAFFIRRPVFATVIAIVTVILGLVSAPRLPIAQYPNVTPPLVTISTVYPGATGQTVSDTVATPIEQQVNGADNMLYMESICTSDGAMTINVTFELGTDPNIDQVLAQNRVSMALPATPELVQKQGVVTQKANPSILLGIAITSPNGSYNTLDLSNFFKVQIYDELLRIPGVGQVNMLGVRDYSMRVWLDPDKLSARNLAAMDVVNAIQEQNVQVAAGVLGQPPGPRGEETATPINVLGRLTELSQFESIVVAVGKQGELVRLRDVVRSTDPQTGRKGVELGAVSYNQNVTFDGKPAILAAVFQLPGTNAIDVADAVYAKLADLKARRVFPDDITYNINYDTTQFIRESAEEVFWTLIESSILVSIVIFIFLQNWRSAIIPIVSLPVSIIGAFAIMAIFGFSFNNLSLFGLVLAIGIVVDDAIVVVENVERNLELGLSPFDAAMRSMNEISGAVIAVTLVLSCVFIPAAFISGITGQFYQQFALTIAGSTLISGINSLTLSPAMCALLLKPKHEHGHHEGALPRFFYVLFFGTLATAIVSAATGHGHFEIFFIRTIVEGLTDLPGDFGGLSARLFPLLGGMIVGGIIGALLTRPINFLWRGFFYLFNSAFRIGTGSYAWIVGKLLRLTVLVVPTYLILLYFTVRLATLVPVGFIPELDKGYFLISVKLPDGASLERTDAVVNMVRERVKDIPGMQNVLGVSGFSLVTSSNSYSSGTLICIMKPFEDRTDASMRVNAVVREVRKDVAAIAEAVVMPFGAPPVDGLGRSGGFKLQVQDRDNLGPEALETAVRKLIRAGNAQPGLIGLTTSYSASLPQLYIDIDREQAKTMGVKLSDVFQTLQIFVGSLYVNQINLYGRTWQVNVQADAEFRLRQSDLGTMRVRNAKGEMVPIGAMVSIREITGPEKVSRYNMFRSAEVMGGAFPTTSSGEVIEIMEALAARELPRGMTISWTDLYYQQIRAGNTSMYVFAFGALMVFLVLAAQYESWSMPLAVILIVPLCILCALSGVAFRWMDNNIFTQVGLLVLVGLSSKNAILIVEFARQLCNEGKDRTTATIEAARARLRPILMTSACFIHMVPLYFAVGAGAEMRRALGTAVLWGAFGVTLFGIFLTPVFFWVIDRLTRREKVG